MMNIDANTITMIIVVLTNLVGVTVVVVKNSVNINQLNKTLEAIFGRFTSVDDKLDDQQRQIKENYGSICELRGKIDKG